jgi:hypothetical protein
VASVPQSVRLMGIRPYEPGATHLRREWSREACLQLGDEALRTFMYLASIASEPGCDLDPTPEGVARHFGFRLRNVRRAYHQLAALGVLRFTQDGYELMDEWGYFA